MCYNFIMEIVLYRAKRTNHLSNLSNFWNLLHVHVTLTNEVMLCGEHNKERKLSILIFCFHTPQWAKFSIAVNWFCTSCVFSYLSLLEVWLKLATGASLTYLTHFFNGLNVNQALFSSWYWWTEQNLVQNWVSAGGSFCRFLPSHQYFSVFPWLQESCSWIASSYTIWSIKPSIHELIVDLALCSQYLATAGFFKAYAIGQAWHDHE